MNVVNIIGRLCADPELRRTQNNTACCSFTLAVKRPKVKDVTDFHNFVVWQQGAEYLSQYGHKGDLVGVTGYLTTREWTDNGGNKRKTTEVTCENIKLISKKSDSTAQKPQAQPTYAQQSFTPIDIPDADLPF